MNVYADTSVLVALFVSEALSLEAERLLRAGKPTLIISDFAAAEFASAISRSVRVRNLTFEAARSVLLEFDEWSARETQRVEVTSADIAVTTSFLRRLDLTLRTPDAINIAVARRLDSRLLTFDKSMARTAQTLGVDVLTS